MDREEIETRYVRLLDDITNLMNNGQMSPELLLQKIKEYQELSNEYPSASRLSNDGVSSTNNTQERIAEILNDVLLNHNSLNNEAIDRQSLSVQIKQIGGAKTTIKDEKIRHTDDGGLHSDVEQAIVISCEGKRIEAHRAEGICEVTGKLAQRALSCRLCHRSICLRHCEFIEQGGEHYPYCNTTLPKSRISCAKKIILSTDTWQEIEKKMKNRRYQ